MYTPILPARRSAGHCIRLRQVLPWLPAAGLILALAWLLLWSPSARAQAQVRMQAGIESGTRAVYTGTVREDLYAAGQTVQVSATAEGDVVAAGGNVEVSGRTAGNAVLAGGNVQLSGDTAGVAIVAGGNVEVSRRVGGDLFAAGGNVELSGSSADDVRVAGGTVTVEGAVGGDLVAASGNLALEREATVGGRAWLAGGQVAVRGTVNGELRVRSDDVHLNGTVRGDADLGAQHVTIGPDARIGGKLVYASPNEARIDPAAQIAGGVERRPMGEVPGAPGTGWGGIVFGIVATLIALFATATVVRFVLPGFSVQTAATLTAHPWKSLALGFALLVCIPVAALVLLTVLIGVPLGLALLLTYPIALALGLLVVAVWLAEAFQRRFFGRRPVPVGWRVLLLWAAVLLLALVGAIPAIGQILLLALLLLGLGALGLHLAARYAAGGAAPPLR